MRIERGTARIAIIGDLYTLKIANIHLRSGLKCLWHYGRGGAKALKSYFSFPIDSPVAFKYQFVRGVSENLREFRTSKTLGDIVVPTRFSFLGIFNIQETAKLHNLSQRLLWVEQCSKIGDELWKDPHTLSSPENYGIHEGRLKIIDYGGARTFSVILKYRQQFREVFDTLSRLSAQAK